MVAMAANPSEPRSGSALDAAATVAAGHDRTRYDDFAILLHWATAALVLLQFATSELWDYFGKPTKHLMMAAHMSFGIMLAAVILLRIAWRLVPGHQVSPADVGWMEVASKGVHYILYALIISQAALGFMLRWSGNEAMTFFGLQLPTPFAPFEKSTHHFIGDAHYWVGWTIIALVGIHAAAVLFHQYVLRDQLLWRMLPQKA
jgi:cytochrome b561